MSQTRFLVVLLFTYIRNSVHFVFFFNHFASTFAASWVALVVKNQLANAENNREVGLIPGSGSCTLKKKMTFLASFSKTYWNICFTEMESSRKKKTLNSKRYIHWRQRASCWWWWTEIPVKNTYVKQSIQTGLMKARRAVCAQSCSALCDSMDHSPPGSYVHGSLQERILKWLAIPSSRESQQRNRNYKKESIWSLKIFLLQSHIQ